MTCLILAVLTLPAQERDLFATDNLTAWLVMFTDPTKRSPKERAVMVKELGFKKVGFEAFDRFVPIFEEQLDAYQRHGIEVVCVWVNLKTTTPSKEVKVRTLLGALKRRGQKPQIWAMFSRNSFKELPEPKRIVTMVDAFSDLAVSVDGIGCKMGLYNYGRWFGKVETQLALIRGIKKKVGIDVGTIFNFHRGHQHMERFPEALAKMRPHLLAVNLNGMKEGGPLILPLGKGDRELQMMRQLQESGYSGPIGIIDHRGKVDARKALQENLDGLEKLRLKLRDSR